MSMSQEYSLETVTASQCRDIDFQVRERLSAYVKDQMSLERANRSIFLLKTAIPYFDAALSRNPHESEALTYYKKKSEQLIASAEGQISMFKSDRVFREKPIEEQEKWFEAQKAQIYPYIWIHQLKGPHLPRTAKSKTAAMQALGSPVLRPFIHGCVRQKVSSHHYGL
jgi:hypothetical protein